MALLNPPEIRPSGIVLIARYLASQRGQQDAVERLVATLAPASLRGIRKGRDGESPGRD